MLTLLKNSEYKKQFWKNGKGTTLQIAIFPENAEVSNNHFLWRISSASVHSSGPFSLYLGFERQLIVWKGQGLILNSVPLLPCTPLTFSGETEIQADLINDEHVIDLGIIYNKNKIHSSLFVQKFLNDSIIKLEPGWHFIFLAEGASCLIKNIKIKTGDSLRVDNNKILHLPTKIQNQVTLFIISLKLIE